MPAIAHQNKILGNTSGGGSTIKVTTSESSLYGQTVTLTDGTTTLTGTFSNAGECEFTGVMMIGTLTATSSTASKSIQVPYFGVYTMTLSFFTATITVTFDASKGATCTLDGVTASTSPYAFTVSSAGTYTASSTLDGVTKQGTAKVITTDGQTETDTIEFGTINLTYANEFRGQSITCAKTGGSTITKTAPSTGNTMSFYPDATGTWEITGAYSGTTYSSGNITVSSLSTAVPATLQTLATITVTIYGATEDTITFTDAASVSHTVVFATGQSSKSETLKVLPSGSSITFTSGVAKDPDNLSNDYTKTVTLTSASTEVYVMPDNALYWWGFNGDMEDCTTANGWSYSGASLSAPVHNTTSVNCVGLNNTINAFATTKTYDQKTVHYILKATSGARYFFTPTKDASYNFNTFNTAYTSLTHITKTSTASTYIGVEGYYNTETVELFALWYE